jgi:hypothetical protein
MLILGSTLSSADEVGWELEKSLVSIAFYKRSLANLSILFRLYIYLKIYVLEPSSLLRATDCNDTLSNMNKCIQEI